MKSYILALAMAVSLSAGVAGAATAPASQPQLPAILGPTLSMTGPTVANHAVLTPVALAGHSAAAGAAIGSGPTGAPVVDIGRNQGQRIAGWWSRALAWARRHYITAGGGSTHPAPLALAGGLPALVLFGGAVGLALRSRRT